MLLPPLRTAIVTASALVHLGAYRAIKAVRGPSPARALEMFQQWSRRTCATLGIEVRRIGDLPSERCAYVANHRSYLDIAVLASLLPGLIRDRAGREGAYQRVLSTSFGFGGLNAALVLGAPTS